MDEEILGIETEYVPYDMETIEVFIQSYNEHWDTRVSSIENAFLIQIVGLALIAGCLIATMILNFFHKR